MATEFICDLKSTGGDYSTFTDWLASVGTDLTVSTTKVFAHGGITGAIADGASVTGSSSSATATVLHATATQIAVDTISGTFTSGEQMQVDASNYVTLSDAGDSMLAVLECYDDWGNVGGGLDDECDLNAFTTSAMNYPIVRAAEGEEQDGTATGSGFTLRLTSAATYVYSVVLAPTSVVSGIRVRKPLGTWPYAGPFTFSTGAGRGTTQKCLGVIETGVSVNTTYAAGFYTSSASGSYFSILDCGVFTEGTGTCIGIRASKNYGSTGAGESRVLNCVAKGSFPLGGINLNRVGEVSNPSLIVKNNAVWNTDPSSTDFVFNNQASNTDAGFTNNASNDTSAGTANNNKQILGENMGFVDATNGNLHISNVSGLRNQGIGPVYEPRVSITDVDGSARSGTTCDLGFDEYVTPPATPIIHTSRTRAIGNRAPKGPVDIERDDPLARGLVGYYWPTPSGMRDLSPIRAHSTDNTATPKAMPGLGLRALDYDGSTNKTTIPLKPAHTITDDITIAAWVQPDVAAVGTVYSIFGSTNKPSYWVTQYGTKSAAWLYGNDIAQIGTQDIFAVGELVLAVWTRRKGETNGIKLYKNGILLESFANSSYPLIAPTKDPLIGIDPRDGTSYQFDGRIGPVGLWNRALSPGEVWRAWAPQTRWAHIWQRKRTYSLPAVTPVATPIVHTSRTRAIGNHVPVNTSQVSHSSELTKGLQSLVLPSLHDAVRKDSAVPYGNPVMAAHPWGQVLDFDGTDDYVDLGTAESRGIDANVGTVLAWVDPYQWSYANTSDIKYVIYKPTASGNLFDLAYVSFSGSTTYWRAQLRGGFGTAIIVTHILSSDAELQRMQLVGFRYDIANGLDLVLDGRAVASSAVTSTNALNVTQQLYIGHPTDFSGGEAWRMLRMMVWDRWLSDGELAALYSPQRRWSMEQRTSRTYSLPATTPVATPIIHTSRTRAIGNRAPVGPVQLTPDHPWRKNVAMALWGSGGTLRDLTRNVPPGVLVNNASMGFGAQSERVVEFDGVDDYVNFPSTLSNISGSQSTLALWARIDGEDAYGRVFWGTTTGASVWWQITQDLSRQVYIHGQSIGTHTAGNMVGTAERLYVFTCDGSTGGFYVNGVLSKSASITPTAIATGAKNWHLGNWIGGASWDHNGSIGPVLFLDRALSAAEVWSLYAPQTRWDHIWQRTRSYSLPATTPVATPIIHTSRTRAIGNRAPSGPFALNKDKARGFVACWPLFGPAGVVDLVAGRRLPLAASDTFSSTMNSQLGLDPGVASSKSITEVKIRDLPTGDFTVAAWAFIPSFNSTNSMISWSGSIDDLVITPGTDAGGNVRVYWRYKGANIINVSGGVSYGVPQRIVFASTGQNDHRLYVNGRQIGSSSATGASYSFTEFLIGYFPGQFFNGQIQHVCLLDRAWSAAEVWKDYDPQTRWDLYWQRKRTIFLPAAAAGGSGFQAAWARIRSGIIGVGVH